MLSKRLGAVADLLEPGNVIADIGCDHGYLPIDLIKSGRFKSAIAADVNEGPLEGAINNISREDNLPITCRLSDGLSAFKPGQVDAISVCGMGGNLMMRILSDGMEVAKAASQLVLQPQSEIPAFRRFLCQNGFRICKEAAVFEDGKYYFLMQVFPDSRSPLDLEQDYCCLPGYDLSKEDESFACFEYGRFLLEEQNEVLIKFLRQRLDKNKSIIENLKSFSKDGQKRRNELEYECRLLDIILSKKE